MVHSDKKEKKNKTPPKNPTTTTTKQTKAKQNRGKSDFSVSITFSAKRSC